MSRLPFDLSIPTPCHQPWHEMSGSAAQRHCASCNKTVHNLATLNPRQIERLIRASNGHLCARITRREDGSVATAPPNSPFLGAPLVLSAALLMTYALHAQEPSQQKTGAIVGVIRDPEGALVPGAKIEVIQPGLPEMSTIAKQDGSFRLEGPVGIHTIQVSMPGFATLMENIQFSPHEHPIPPIVLQVGVVTMGEIVVVDNRPWYKKLGSKTKRLLHLSS